MGKIIDPAQQAAPKVDPLSIDQIVKLVNNYGTQNSSKMLPDNLQEKYGGKYSGIEDHSLIPVQEQDEQQIMSERQGGAQQAYNAILGGIENGVLGFAESMVNLPKLVSNDWETNAVSEFLAKTKQENKERLPVYSNPENPFSWDSSMLWNTVEGFIDNGLQFGLAGGAVSKGLGLIGDVASLGAKEAGALSALEKLSDASSLGKKANALINGMRDSEAFMSALKSVPAGYIMNDIEGTMEGQQTYDTVRKEYLDKGFSKEEAESAAAKAASQTKFNNKALMLQDILTMHGLWGAKDQFTNSLLNEPRLISRWKTIKQGLNPLSKEFYKDLEGNLLVNAVGEGAEELFQGVIQDESARDSYIEGNKEKPGAFSVDERGFFDRLKDNLTDPDNLYQGFQGAVSGPGQRLASNAVAVLSDKIKYNKIENDIASIFERMKSETNPETKATLQQQLDVKQRELESTWKGRYTEQQKVLKDNEELKKSFSQLADSFYLYDNAVAKGDEVSQKLLEDNMFTTSVLKNLRKGTISSFQQMVQDFSEGNVDPTVEKGLSEDYKDKASEMLDKVKEMRQDYIQSQRYINSEEVFFTNQNIKNTREALEKAKENVSKTQEALNKVHETIEGKTLTRIQNKIVKGTDVKFTEGEVTDDQADIIHERISKKVKSTPEYEAYKRALSTLDNVKDILDSHLEKKAYLTDYQYEKGLKKLNTLIEKDVAPEGYETFIDGVKDSNINEEGKKELIQRAERIGNIKRTAQNVSEQAAANGAASAVARNNKVPVVPTPTVQTPVVDNAQPKSMDEIVNEVNQSSGQKSEVIDEDTTTSEDELKEWTNPSATIENPDNLNEDKGREKEDVVQDQIPVEEIILDYNEPSTEDTQALDDRNQVRNPTKNTITKFKNKFQQFFHFKNENPGSTLAWLNRQYKEFAGGISTIAGERLRPELNTNKYNATTPVKFSIDTSSIEFKAFNENQDYLDFPITVKFGEDEVGFLHTPRFIVELKDSNGLSFYDTKDGQEFLKEIIKIAQEETYDEAESKIEMMYFRLFMRSSSFAAENFRNIAASLSPDKDDLGNLTFEFVKNVKFRQNYLNHGLDKAIDSEIESISTGFVSQNVDEDGRVYPLPGKDALPDPDLQFVIIKDGNPFKGRIERLVNYENDQDSLDMLSGSLAVSIPMRASLDGVERNVIMPVKINKIGFNKKTQDLAHAAIQTFLGRGKLDSSVNNDLGFDPMESASNLHDFFRLYVTYIKYKSSNLTPNKINVDFTDDTVVQSGVKERAIRFTIPGLFINPKYINTVEGLSVQIDKTNITEVGLENFLENYKGAQITKEDFYNLTYGDLVNLWLSESHSSVVTDINNIDIMNNKNYKFPVLEVTDKGIETTEKVPYNDFIKRQFTTTINGKDQHEGKYIYNDQPTYDLSLNNPNEKKSTSTQKMASDMTETEIKVDQFADDIQEGKQKTDLESLQFYENNKKEIEAELLRRQKLDNLKPGDTLTSNIDSLIAKQTYTGLQWDDSLNDNEDDIHAADLSLPEDQIEVQKQIADLSAVPTDQGISLDKQNEVIDAMKAYAIGIYFGRFKGLAPTTNKGDIYKIIKQEFENINNLSGNQFQYILDNWANFVNKTELALRQIGFSVKAIPSEERETSNDAEFSGESGKALENYNDSVYQLNPIEGASGRLKARLSVISSGEDTIFRIPKMLNVDDVFTDIKRMVSDVPNLTFNKVIDLLMQDKTGKVYYKNIASDMRKWDRQTINEFMSVMNGQKFDFNIILWENKNGEYSLRPIDSNRVSAFNILANKWNENFKLSNVVISKGGDKFVSVPEMTKIYNDYLNILSLTNKEAQVKALHGLFNRIGIDITEDETITMASNLQSLKGSLVGKASHRVSSDWGKALKDENGLIRRLFNPFNIELSEYANVTKEIEGKSYIHLDNYNPMSHGDYKKFAKYIVKSRENLFTDSFKNINNDTVFGYGMYYHFKEYLNKLQNDEISLDTDSFAKDSYLYQNRHEISLSLTDGLKNVGTDQEVAAQNVSSNELEMRYLALIQNQGGQNVKVPLPTLSDKTQFLDIEMPRINTPNGITEPIMSILRPIAHAEIKRITDHNPINNKAYDEGFKYFYFFPLMNKVLFEDAIQKGQIKMESYSPTMWGELKGTFVPTSEVLIDTIIQHEINRLVGNRLKKWNENGINLKKMPFDKKWLKENKYDQGVPNKRDILIHAAYEYEINSFVAGASFYQVFAKDPALNFKGKHKEAYNTLTARQVSDNIKTTMSEAVKRNAKEIAPGKKPYFVIWGKDENGKEGWIKQTTYNSLFIADKDGGTKSEFVNNSKYKDAYKSIDNTDAQEFTSLTEHLHVSFALGYIPVELYQTLLKKAEMQAMSDQSKPLAEEAKLTEQEMTYVLQIHKPVQVIDRIVNGKSIATYVKSSSMPLFRQVTEGFDINRLTKIFNKGNVDRIAYQSAVKMGATNVVNLYGEDGRLMDAPDIPLDYINNLSRDGFYIQQEVPYDEEKEAILTISQMNKLITEGIENLKFNHKGESLTGKELKQRLVDLRDEMFTNAKTKLFKELSISETVNPKTQEPQYRIKNIEKVKNLLVSEAIKRKYPENDIYSLATANNEFILSLFFNPSSNKFESLLTSAFSKIVKQKVPGRSFIQATGTDFITDDEFDFNNSAITFTDKFDPKRGLEYMKEGVTQVLIPWKFRDANGNPIDINQFKTNGKLDMSKIDPELLRMIGARIPNQGHNSMSAIEIAGFLPTYMADTVIIPSEFTKQMGADFDVDKLYGYMYGYTLAEGKLMKKTPESKDVIQELTRELKALNKDIDYDVDKLERFKKRILAQDEVSDLLEDYPYYAYSIAELSIMSFEKAKEELLNILEAASPISKLNLMHNDYIDYHWTILTHPEVQNKIIEPLDKKDLAKEKALIEDNQNEDLSINSIASAQFNQNALIENRAGKQGVAIESLASTFNSVIQGKKVSLYVMSEKGPKDFGISVNNGSENLFLFHLGDNATSTYDREKRSIASVISIIQSEAVDNAKNNTLGKCNLNPHTFNAANVLALLSDGKGNSVGIDTIVRFLTQDSIIAYVKAVENEFDTTNEDFVKNKKALIRQQILNRYTSHEEVSKTIPSPEKLKSLRETKEENRDDPDYKAYQFMILNQFFMLDDIGQALRDVQSINNIDSKGIGKSFLEAQKFLETFKKVENGTVTSPIYNILFKNIDKLVSESEIGSVFQHAIKPGLEISKDFYPYSSQINDVFRLFEKLNGPLSTDKRRGIINAFKSYVYTDSRIYGEYARAERQRLYGVDNIFNRLQEAQDTWGKGNYFLSRLQVVLPEKKGEFAKVTYVASNSDRLDSSKNTEAILNLLNSKDETKKKLINDLLEHSLLTKPIQASDNFIKYIPSAVFLQSNVSILLNNNIDRLLNKEFNLNQFLDQYIQHNPKIAVEMEYDSFIKDSENRLLLPSYANIPVGSDLSNVYVKNLSNSLKTPLLDHLDAPNTPPPYIKYSVRGGNGSSETYLLKTIENQDGSFYLQPMPILGSNGMTFYSNNYSDNENVQKINPSRPIEGNGIVTNNYVESIVNDLGITKEEKGSEFIQQMLSVIQSESRADFALLASILKSNPEFLSKITIKQSDTVGLGSYQNGKIEINPKKFSLNGNIKEEVTNTVLHEMLHAVTSDRYNLYLKDRSTVSFKEASIFDRIEDLRIQAIQKVDQQKLKTSINKIYNKFGSRTDLSISKVTQDETLKSYLDPTLSTDNIISAEDKLLYSLINGKEFITAIMQDREFQELMNSVKVGEKSMLDKFVDLIQKYLDIIAELGGLKINKDSVLAEGVKSVIELLHTQHNNIVSPDVIINTPVQENVNEEEKSVGNKDSDVLTKGLNHQLDLSEDKENTSTSNLLSKQNLFTVTPIQSADKKAIAKASIANKFIGFAEGIPGSSTAEYAKQITDQFGKSNDYIHTFTKDVNVGTGYDDTINEKVKIVSIKEGDIKNYKSGKNLIDLDLYTVENKNGKQFTFHLGPTGRIIDIKFPGRYVRESFQESEQNNSPKTTINNTKWTKDSPKENPNTAYIFTENINSIGSSRVGSGSAIIRNNPNAIGIVTKKYYVYTEDRATSKITGGWNQDFQNTESDFELFKKINLEQFSKIDKYNNKIFPQGFASDLAKIPTKFAEWLQIELLNRYGLITELNSNKTGLISKGISVKSNIVNSGNYNSNDIVFVSIGGKRGSEEIRKEQQNKTIKEAIKAIEAGATLITDNKAYIESSTYNEGEKRLAKNLEAKGYNYSEQIVDGEKLGIWSKNSDVLTKGLNHQLNLFDNNADLSLSERQGINYNLKSVNILLSDKAKDIFSKGEKNKWSLDKILSELQIPKDQKELLLNLGIDTREKLALEIASRYNYVVEINTTKGTKSSSFDEEGQALDDSYMYDDTVYKTKYENSDYYSNMTVPGGTNYTENEISTPLITPSIKGHAQFSTDKGIGWFRSDEKLDNAEDYTFDDYKYDQNENPYKVTVPMMVGGTETKIRRILEVQSDLFQKGRDKDNLTATLQNKGDSFVLNGVVYDTNIKDFKTGEKTYTKRNENFGWDIITKEEYDLAKKELNKENKENQFLQLLNKDNNWVTFFIKSIIQDSAKQTITKVQESDVEAKVKELEKNGLLEIDCKGKIKAEKGLQTNFTKGGKWKLIKDLKGYPTHKEGGVDLTIGKNGVSIKNGNTEFAAKHGLVIPKN